MTRPYGTLIGPTPNWSEDERPTLAGSAATPLHSRLRRVAYGLIAVLLAITGGLGNALITANLPQIQGTLALTPVQGSWLLAAYFMTNVSANLLLFKFRQQYGLRVFVQLGMPLYAISAILHLVSGTFASAIIARLVSGFATAVCSSLGVLYMLQAFEKKRIAAALALGVGLTQLSVPIAWLLSPPLLDVGEWRTLYLFEGGLAILCWAAVSLLHLPPSQRIQVFEWQDLLTYALLTSALALIIAVLAQGRMQWWTAEPWIGWALIGALVLGTIGFVIEHYRRHPLVQVRWLGGSETVMLMVGALAIRFLLSEQTFGAVGLLRLLNQGPDQLQTLYGVMLVALTFGIGVGALTLNPKTIVPQILVAVVAVAIASFIDRNATAETRPQSLYLSQAIVSVGTGMFLGPLMIVTMLSGLKRGPDYLVSALVLFSVTQSIGGLLGPAALGTFQQLRQHEYSAQINASVNPTDPLVADRLRLQGGVFAAVVTDPVQRQARGVSLLAQTASREANVRAFNDVFTLTGLLAIGALLSLLVNVIRAGRRQKAQG